MKLKYFNYLFCIIISVALVDILFIKFRIILKIIILDIIHKKSHA